MIRLFISLVKNFVNASYLSTPISCKGKTYTITAQEPSIYELFYSKSKISNKKRAGPESRNESARTTFYQSAEKTLPDEYRGEGDFALSFLFFGTLVSVLRPRPHKRASFT